MKAWTTDFATTTFLGS